MPGAVVQAKEEEVEAAPMPIEETTPAFLFWGGGTQRPLQVFREKMEKYVGPRQYLLSSFPEQEQQMEFAAQLLSKFPKR